MSDRPVHDDENFHPASSQDYGALRLYAEVRSHYLPHAHDVVVCLPPGYERDFKRRYPVMYLHDGQNVFDDYPMAPFGVQWGIDTTSRALIHARLVEPVILVAIGNAGRERIDEYTPTRDNAHDAGGMADKYGSMLVNEIKPMIDHDFRTLTDPMNTGVGGSSLGGLLSLHLGLTYPHVFGKLALLSPSVWWDDRWIVRQLATFRAPHESLRIWLDVGTGETRMLKGARLLCRTLLRRGWQMDVDLKYHEAPGALHDERSWGERVGQVMQFLFPANRSTPQTTTVRT
ncbi:MAG: alpha/beta hydrolase [Gemmatimonas sp.]